jgi:hypothetical protein
LVLEL